MVVMDCNRDVDCFVCEYCKKEYNNYGKAMRCEENCSKKVVSGEKDGC